MHVNILRKSFAQYESWQLKRKIHKSALLCLPYLLLMSGLKLSLNYCVTTGYLLHATPVATQKGHELLKWEWKLQSWITQLPNEFHTMVWNPYCNVLPRIQTSTAPVWTRCLFRDNPTDIAGKAILRTEHYLLPTDMLLLPTPSMIISVHAFT